MQIMWLTGIDTTRGVHNRSATLMKAQSYCTVSVELQGACVHGGNNHKSMYITVCSYLADSRPHHQWATRYKNQIGIRLTKNIAQFAYTKNRLCTIRHLSIPFNTYIHEVALLFLFSMQHETLINETRPAFFHRTRTPYGKYDYTIATCKTFLTHLINRHHEYIVHNMCHGSGFVSYISYSLHIFMIHVMLQFFVLEVLVLMCKVLVLR